MKHLMKLFAVALVAMSFAFMGCKSSKGSISDNEVEVSNECIDLAMQKPTRSWGDGTALNISNASSAAEGQARIRLQRKIESAVLGGVKAYEDEMKQASSANDGGLHDIHNQEVLEEVAGGVVKFTNIIKTQVFKGKDDNGNTRYHVFVTIEYNGDIADMAKDVIKKAKANAKISDKERKRIEKDEKKLLDEIKKQLEQMR